MKRFTKKASAIVEAGLILCLVACVAVVMMKVFNDQKMKLTEMSKVTPRETQK